MIDFHNHIVPNVDDGVKSYDDVRKMLKTAQQQGITEIVATPHRQHPKFEMMNITDDQILQSFQKLVNFIDSENIPIKVHLSAEIFYQPNLLALIDHPFAIIGGYRNILVEFPINFLPLSFEKIFRQLLDIGVVPIIAHPERYKPIQEDFSILRKLYNMDVLIQLDAGSIIGNHGVNCQKLSKKILSKGYAQFIGSDAHNSKKRNFCLEPAYDFAKKVLKNDADFLVLNNPHSLIYGDDIVKFRTKSEAWHNWTHRVKNIFSSKKTGNQNYGS